MIEKNNLNLLKQNVWDERFYPILRDKIKCLENALEKINDYENENGMNDNLRAVKDKAITKLSNYRSEIAKPFEIQLSKSFALLEKEYDEAEKDIIRTRIMDIYISLTDFNKAYEYGIELLKWNHFDVWNIMKKLYEADGIPEYKITDVQNQYFEHFFKFKNNTYLWNNFNWISGLNHDLISINTVNKIFKFSESITEKQENIAWNAIGIMFYYKNEYLKAIQSYSKAIDFTSLEDENYNEDMAIYYGNIAEANLKLNNFENALGNSLKGLEYQPDNKTLVNYKLLALRKGKL